MRGSSAIVVTVLGVVGVDALLLTSSGDRGSDEQLDARGLFFFNPMGGPLDLRL
jgi:hypothetical protein